MNEHNPGVTEDDLHAYVDGLLDEDRRREVEAWLAADPEAAARVAKWQRQNAGLDALFGNAATGNPGDAERVARLMRPPLGRSVKRSATTPTTMNSAAAPTMCHPSGRCSATAPAPRVSRICSTLRAPTIGR